MVEKHFCDRCNKEISVSGKFPILSPEIDQCFTVEIGTNRGYVSPEKYEYCYACWEYLQLLSLLKQKKIYTE